jgi:branched-chain amino acid aminotransferase
VVSTADLHKSIYTRPTAVIIILKGLLLGAAKEHERVVFVDGHFVPESEARISPFDHGLLYGYGIWDTAFVYNGCIFWLNEHIDRLFLSAKALGLGVPWSKNQVKEIIIETVRRNELKEAYIKYLITRGSGEPHMTARCGTPTVVVLVVSPPEPFTPPELSKGRKAVIVSIRSIPPQCGIEPRIKQLNYLNRALMVEEAIRAGADQALAMDINGFVVEGATNSLFVVRNDVIYTTPLQNVLEGVTRGIVLDIAARRGRKVVEKMMTPYDIYVADEVFTTATAASGIVPIVQVDGRMIGTGNTGPITKEIMAEYWQMLQKCEGGTRVL